MPRPTMFDQYGRCIHCGFWHADLDSPAAQACGAHEAEYLGTGKTPWGACGCVMKPAMPVPRRTAAGLYVVPGHPEYETASEISPELLPTVGGLLNSARPVGKLPIFAVGYTGDGVALQNAVHPLPPWYLRPWHWLQRLFGSPRLDPNSIENVAIEIKERK